MLLECTALCRSFGGLQAVNNVDMSLGANEIVGLIGPNGAGKTTFFNVLTGVFPADSGTCRFRGDDITRLRTHQIARKGLVRTFQQIRLFSNLSVIENVMIGRHVRTRADLIGAIVRGPRVRAEEEEILERAAEVLAFIGLEDVSRAPAKDLPYGHRRLVEIARALASEPALMLVDEPTAGLNPTETWAVMELLARIRDRGIGLIVIEHHMKAIMSISDRLVVLDHGEKLFEGTPSEVQHNEQVIAAYLGKEVSHAKH